MANIKSLSIRGIRLYPSSCDCNKVDFGLTRAEEVHRDRRIAGDKIAGIWTEIYEISLTDGGLSVLTLKNHTFPFTKQGIAR